MIAAGGIWACACVCGGVLFCAFNPTAELPLVPTLAALSAAVLQSFHRNQENLAVADEAERQLDATPDTLSLQDQLQHKQQQAVQGAGTGAGEEEVQAQVQVRAEGVELAGRQQLHCIRTAGTWPAGGMPACLPVWLKLSHSLCCRRYWQR